MLAVRPSRLKTPHTIKVIAFPFAGGSSSSYQELARHLGDDIEFVCIGLPGRGELHGVSFYDSWTVLVSDLAEEVARQAEGAPFCFFGHSFGALLAFEVCRHLARCKGQQPVALFLSACPAPQVLHEKGNVERKVASLPDGEFIDALRAWGVVPDETLNDPIQVDYLLPSLRADLLLYESHADAVLPASDLLSVPCVVFNGSVDASVSQAELDAWHVHFEPGVQHERFEGGHFYFQPDGAQASVAACLELHVRRVLSSRPPSLIRGEALPHAALTQLAADVSNGAGDAGVISAIHAQAKRLPDAVAIHDGGRRWTYSEMAAAAVRLADELTDAGIGPGDVVGVFLPHCGEYTLAILGAWSVGASVCLLERSWPDTLLTEFIAGCNVRRLLTVESFLERAQTLLPRSQCAVVSEPALADFARPWAPAPCRPGDIAFVSLTSGSTGKPKAVLTTHGGTSYCFQARDWVYPYLADEREGLNVFFAWECLRPLMHGRPSVVISDDVVLDPPRLLSFLLQERITRLVVTPSLLESLLDFPGHAEKFAAMTAHMSAWFLMGEVVPERLVDKASACFAPHVRLVNAYSTWESLDVSYADLLPRTAPGSGVPAGRPLPGCLLAVLDESGEPVPMGVAGELYIGTPALGPGYLGDEVRTRERFVSPPPQVFARHGHEAAVYRTGDSARIRADGQLAILGRMDSTVKIRGFKVSLHAIEAVLDAIDGVGKSLVLPVMDSQTGQPAGLVAYVVGPQGLPSETTLARLRQQARVQLPEYAVPGHVIGLPDFPLRGNGSRKLDKGALPVPTSASAAPSLEPAFAGAPGTGLERQLAAVWAEVLGLAEVQRADHFFQIGGNSLAAAKVAGLLAQRLGLSVGVLDLYQHSTIAELAAHCHRLAGPREPATPVEATQGARRSQAGAHPGIALVGMAGRFPGADDVDAFWQNLLQGIDSLRRFSREELLAQGVDAAQLDHPGWVPVGQVVEDADKFDAPFFGISQREAVLMDPQHRLFMEVAWSALEQAGYARSDNPYRERTGVYAACGIDGYLVHHLQGGGLTTPLDPGRLLLTEIGNEKDYIATRVAYQLDLGGPAITVACACSSALVAVVQAAEAILAGRCDMAIAGASALTFPNFGFCYEDGLVGSVDGRVRPFDAQASGTLFGDSVGAVVLKRLDLAEADGDLVLARLTGVGLSNDGRAKAAYTAPSADAQRRCITQALDMAGLRSGQLSYVECHATATLIGDAIELKGLSDAFEQTRGADPIQGESCVIGSVKGNVGHANCAAGITGLIKTVLQMQHRQLVPTVNLDALNSKLVPFVEHSGSPFKIQREVAPWDVAHPAMQLPRRAGVSSFGIGGTNAHLILEESPPSVAGPAGGQVRPLHLMTVSARSHTALARQLEALAEHVSSAEAPDVANCAYTLHTAREAHPLRICASVSADPCEAAAQLRERAAQLPDELPRIRAGATVAFCFSGQGSQHAGMGRELYAANAEIGRFRMHFDRACEALQPHLGTGIDVASLILDADDAAMQRPVVTQCGLFALEHALAGVLLDCGLRPVAVAGHSIGQYAAAVVAGVLSLAQAAQLVATRAVATERLAGFASADGTLQPGGMMSVTGDEGTVRNWLAGRHDVWFAVRNAPGVVVLAGLRASLALAEEALAALGCVCKPVPVSHPFHTPLMQPVAEALASASIAGGMPKVPMACNVTGGWLGDAVLSPMYWADHLLAPVQWADNVAALLRWQPDVVLEVGPGSVLRSLVHKCAQAMPEPGTVPKLAALLPRTGAPLGEVRRLSEALGELWCAGVPIDWPAYHTGEATAQGQALRRCVLPGYPFDRFSHWTRPEASIYVKAAPETAEQASPVQADSRWLRCVAPRPQARLKLYGFPYAGGSSRSFAGWAASAPEWLEFVAVEWPGRNARADEPLACSDADDAGALQQIARAIQADAGELPVAFCGLSYGAAAAVELLCGPLSDWARSGQVKGLAVVGRAPLLEPQQADADIDSFLLVPAELRANALWREIFYPILQADLAADARTAQRVSEQWSRSGCRPLLALPVQVHGGLNDPAFDGRRAEEWAPLSAVPLAGRHLYPGGHDFMLQFQQDILARVAHWLKPHRQPAVVAPAPIHAMQWRLLAGTHPQETLPWIACNPGEEALALDWLSTRLRAPDARVALLYRCSAVADRGLGSCASFLVLWQALMRLECQGQLSLLLPANADSGPLAGLARVASAEYAPLGVQLLVADDHPDLQACEGVSSWVERVTRQAMSHRREPWLWRACGRVFVPRLEAVGGPALPPGALAQSEGHYLVTGAAGGLGGALIDWLIDEQGVPPQRIVALQRRVTAGHRGVQVVAADLTDPQGLDAALKRIPRVEGIFHLAGVLDDGVIARLDRRRLEQVLWPKQALGTLLEHATRWNTAWALAFSSTSALLGVPGQANYAAANAWLDHLALWPSPAMRTRLLSVQWGSWAEVGMSARGDKALQRARQDGERPLATERALAALGVVLAGALGRASPAGVFAVCDVEWPASPWAELPLLAELARPSPSPAAAHPLTPAQAQRPPSQDAPASASPDDPIRAFLGDYLTHWDERLDLGALGLDSLDIAQVRNGFFKRFGRQIPLSVLASPDVTLGELARRLKQVVEPHPAEA